MFFKDLWYRKGEPDKLNKLLVRTMSKYSFLKGGLVSIDDH